MSRLIDLHRFLNESFTSVVGVSRPRSGGTVISWDGSQTKDMELAAQKIADEWDFTDKPMPTEDEIALVVSRLTPVQRQVLLDNLLLDFAVQRPDILEKING